MLFRLVFWIISKRMFNWLNREFKSDNFYCTDVKDLLYYYCLFKTRKAKID